MVDFIIKANECSYYPCSIIVISLGTEINIDDLDLLNKGNYDNYFFNNEKVQSILPFRKNTIFINFNELFKKNDEGINDKSVKSNLKSIYREIDNQFSEYVKIKNILPFDFKNLNSKTVKNYVELRKHKFSKINTCIYQNILIEEKEKLILNLKQVAYNIEDLENAFDSAFPTFETHFIINVLNNYKLKRERQNFKLEITNYNKEYILYQGKLMIDERKNFSFENNTEMIKNVKSQTKSEKIENVELMCFNDKICNICDERKINIVFKLCKHKYCCEYCLDENLKNCPICKNNIKSFVRLYNL